MPSIRRALPAFLALASLSALAQAKYPVDKVTITGGAPYTDPEILSIAQLKPGDVLTMATLAGPAQRLLDTGLFDSAEMELIGPGSRTAHLSLKPTPLATLLPASFENFVWWTPEELTEALHTHVPVYRGVCSDAGNLPDLIQTSLEQMLAEKGVQATTSHTIVEPTTDHPQRVVNFKIESPRIRLASVDISGTPPELAHAMQQIIQRFGKSSYNEGLTGITTRDLLLMSAQNAGYLSADLTSVQRSITGAGVAYTAQLVAGEPYKVASIAWQPTPVYSAADFNKDTLLHPGDLASGEALRKTEAKIIAAYRAQGYIDAYITPGPTLDNVAHTVAYALQAVPGEVYRLKTVTPLNLTPEAQQEFDASWRIKPNDVYNESYVARFITNNSALKHLAGYTASFQAVGDPATHLVDLTITFVPGRPIR
jgi:outer membrane protein assembly factor BamA